MNYRRFIVLIIALLVLAALAGSSCSKIRNIKGSISGTVYMDGRPISGHLLIKDAATKAVVAQADTNMNGHFIAKDLNAGEYIIQYLNMQGVPFGNETLVKVSLGKFEAVDIKLKATDRKPMENYTTN
jgi:hypothetical protein